MDNAIREAILLVRVQQYPVQASELARRGDLKAAIQLMGVIEGYAGELKMLLARRNAPRG